MALDKQSFRHVLKIRRAELDPELRRIMDGRIRDAVLKSAEWKAAKVVLTYLSFGDEVGTRMLIKAAFEQGKRVAIPRVVPGPERRMAWYFLESMEQLTTRGALEKSAFGVEEPPADEIRRVDVAGECAAAGEGGVLALVPGLAFDARGYRMGYGGGYYDVFLAENPQVVSLGLCRRAFYLTEIPFMDEHDRPVTRMVVG